MRFLSIIRYPNLIMLALFQSVIWFYLLEQYQVPKSVSDYFLIVHILATLFIAAAGNIINDIYDLEIDQINKPHKIWIPNLMSLKKAWLFYISLNVLGLIAGFWVSWELNKIWFWSLYWIPVFLLFLYAIRIKKVLYLNNIMVAGLITYSLFLVFKLALSGVNALQYYSGNFGFTLQETLSYVLLFAFILNWIREIVKDAEDVIGDTAHGVNSLPSKFGWAYTLNGILLLTFFLIGIILAIAVSNRINQKFFAIYLILAVGLSLFLFVKQLKFAKQPKDYHKLSMLLKIIMLIGFFSVFLIKI